MKSKYEQRYLIDLARRVSTGFRAHSFVAHELSSWLEDQDLGFAWDPEADIFKRKGVPPKVWSELRARLAERDWRGPRPKPDALARNVAAFATHVGLSAEEHAIFELAVLAARNGPVRSLCNMLVDEARLTVEDAVTRLTGLSPVRVGRALANSGRLTAAGLLEFEKPPLTGLGLVVTDRLLSAIHPPSRSLNDILGKMFAVVEPGTVAWEEFDHVGPGRDFALRLVQGALKRREKGVNILLHGIPGTGKTAFCQALATRLGAALHAVGETDDDGGEPSRFERLQQLRLGQRLLREQRDSIILFDEMEDLFPGLDTGFFGLAARRSGSKVHFNRLLEANPVPTLWTTNDISDCDPAFLRRITFTLELRTPPAAVRARIWERLAAQHEVPLSRDLCFELAQGLEDAPALAQSALRATRIARGDAEDVKLAATAMSRAVRGGHTPLTASGGVRFEPELANADHDLSLITDRFISRGPTGIGGLCLSGPPGTGKSAFARYLADRMHMPVLERRASDLLDRYVGGSERNIAAAFAEARDTRAFLVFDEADSLLGARDGATHRWEISQVNEMLTWMESHPLPFACTANLVDQLDPATARRFSLRIEFRPLSPDQLDACFHRFFGIAPPAPVEGLDLLTPGDFAVVARRTNLLGLTDPHAIMAELIREQAVKPGARNPVGFRVAH